MELTQIKGGQLGSKLVLEGDKSVLLPMPIGQKGETGKEIGKIETEDGKKILTPHEDIHTEINKEKVSDKVEVKHGDTIGIGDNKDILYAAHKPGEDLTSEKIDEHFEKSGKSISSEDMFVLISAIKQKQSMIVGTAIGILFIVVFIFAGTVYYIYSSGSTNLIKEINQRLYPVQTQINDLTGIIGSENYVCDDSVEDCYIDPDSVVGRINSLEEKGGKIEADISGIKAYNETLNIVKDKVSELDQTVSSGEIQPEIKEKIDGMIKGFVENFQNQQNLNQKIESLSLQVEKIDNLAKQVADIQLSIDSVEEIDLGENGENVGNAIRILLNKVFELQEEVRGLRD